MFGRQRSATAEAPEMSRIVADLAGATISGQVAIGEHIVQIHAEHGAVVNYVAEPQRPVARLRAAPVRRLPRDFPHLLGRERELSLATAQSASGSSVELVGRPGIGKTALLRHLAHRTGTPPSDPVLFTWCGAQPFADLQQFLFEGLYECDGQVVPTPSQLSTYLHGQRALVLLDDVDIDRPALERLMDSLPQGVFVYSSQSRRMFGEGCTIELAGLEAPVAIALIERELGRPLAPAERATATQLVASLEGHPLAILESAATTFRTSRGPYAGVLLDALAALPGVPVPTTDLAAVTGLGASAAAELEALEARRLVQSHSPRYSLAGRPSVHDGAAEYWRARLLERFVAAAQPPPGDQARAQRAEWAAPPILALLDWAERARRPTDVLALARAADGVLALGARWGAWGEALDHALRAARASGDQVAEAWALHQIGSRALCLEDVSFAAASLSAALEIRERLGDERGAALTRHNLDLLDGGAPVPPHHGGGGPRPPALTVLLTVALLALGAGGAAATLLPSDDHTPPPYAQTATNATSPAEEKTTTEPEDPADTTTPTRPERPRPPQTQPDPPPRPQTQPPPETATTPLPPTETETQPPPTATTPPAPIEKKNTDLTMACPPTQQPFPSVLEVSGVLYSAPPSAEVDVVYTHEDGAVITRPATTGKDGTFRASLAPEQPGVWTTRASFRGDDQYVGSASASCETRLG